MCVNRGMIIGLMLLCGCGDSGRADPETHSPREACVEHVESLGLRIGFDAETGVCTLVGCSALEGKTSGERRTLALVDALAEVVDARFVSVASGKGKATSGLDASRSTLEVAAPWEFNGVSMDVMKKLESLFSEEESAVVQRFADIVELRVDGEVYIRSRLTDESEEAVIKDGVTAESLIGLLNDRGIPCEILFASETRQESAVVLTCRLPGMRK